MSTTITGSGNITLLESRIVANLCDGTFSVDISPSIFTGVGYNNVLGASVKITNPYNVVIKNYPTSGYDIYPPMSGVIEVDVPTQANNYQYGKYIIDVQLTDSNGTIYTVSKSVSICDPDKNNKTRNYGSLSAQINGICTDGKVYVIVDTVPTYNGLISDSQTNDFTLEYPTSSGLPVLNTDQGYFSAVLFEGVYKFTGTICAQYIPSDNVYINVNYKIKKEKNVKCLLDETCVYAALSQLQSKVNSDCSDAEKLDTQNTIIQALFLLKTIEVGTKGGLDTSDFIDLLEATLGCVCTCNCAEGTPIINPTPSHDIAITGCNVGKTTAGLTDNYVINNYAYTVSVAPNGGIITISTATLADCTKTQVLTLNLTTAYSALKSLFAADSTFMAGIIKSAITGLDVSCLGISQGEFEAETLKQFFQMLITNICEGGECTAQISNATVTNTAADVTLGWTNVTGVYEVAVYMDGILKGTVLYSGTSFKILGAADGSQHVYSIVPKCNNGSIGTALQGAFTYFGCPVIAVPTVSATSVPSATCPYNLSALVSALPAGITAEWHNLNNTLATSLVADATQVNDGTYYVFAKNINGCYSLGVQVVIVCSATTNCSAPQNLLVESIGGGFRARFQGAAFPPPSNSYTVKRRLKSDPDVSGSYTTIGTPTFNSGVNRWEILDAAGSNNTLYAYRAISNCASSAPYIDYDFANLTCPVVTLTPGETTMGYSFTNVGGGVNKYLVEIYDESGITLIHTDTILPAFPTPITGTFFYLTSGVNYNVRVKVYIGTYFTTCAFVLGTTTYNYILTGGYNMSIDSVTGTGVPTLAATGVSGTKAGHQTGISGTLTITLSGSLVTTTKLVVLKNNVAYACTAVPGAGSYGIAVTALVSDIIKIAVNVGVC